MNERKPAVNGRDVVLAILCLAAGGAAMSLMYLKLLQPDPGTVIDPAAVGPGVPRSDGSFEDALRERAALRARLDELMRDEARQSAAAAYLDARGRLEACERAIDDLTQHETDELLRPPPSPFEPMPFPDGINPVYRDARALRSRTTAGLAAAGLEGHVEVVDCSGFPCIVSGWSLAPDEISEDELEEKWAIVYTTMAARLPPSSWHVVGGGPLPHGAPGRARAFHLAMWPYVEDPSALRIQVHRRVLDATRGWEEPAP